MGRFINPVPRFTDDAGNPLVNGKLYFYTSGTAIDLTTYADSDYTIPNTNPVILSGGGEAPNIFYVGNAKVVLTDSDDSQSWERDPVTQIDFTDTGIYLGWDDTTTTGEIGKVAVVDSDGDLVASNITSNTSHRETTGNPHGTEGTDILSTGETGGIRFLREDGDNTCSWQTPVGGGDVTAVNSPVLNDFARFTTATSIEGRSYSEVKADLTIDLVDNTSDATKNSATATLTNKTIKGNSNTLQLDSYFNLAALRAITFTPIPNQHVIVLNHSNSNDYGYGIFFWNSTSVDTDDDGITIKVTSISTGRWKRLIEDVVYAPWFGAKGDGSDETAEAQAAADYCSAKGKTLYFPATNLTGVTIYSFTSKISFSGPVSVEGENKTVTLQFTSANGLEWSNTSGIIRGHVRNIGLSQTVRHTTTPNTATALKYLGDTTNRPYWWDIENVFIDGFKTAIQFNWTWATKIDKVDMVFGGIFLDSNGISVINVVTNCNTQGNGIALDIGDGTNTSQGWFINNNLFNAISVGSTLKANGASYGHFYSNECDFQGPGTSILLQSAAAGTLPSNGWDIKNNYIAFGAAGLTGIRALNNGTSADDGATRITGNTIFAYSGSSLQRGILVDGTNEDYALVKDNITNATVYDCEVGTGLSGVNVTDNDWLGSGFYTLSQVEYSGNEGAMLSSVTLLKNAHGGITHYYGTVMPTSGTFNAGDIVHKTNPSIDGNNMVLSGWIRLTTGSGNVLGTDWAAQYVSHVSPAN